MKKGAIILISLLSISSLTGCGEKKSQHAANAGDSETVVTTGDETNAEAGDKNVFGYVKFGSVQDNGQLQLLFDEAVYIRGNDTETLIKYGYDPEDVVEDYRIHNPAEKWVPIVTNPETTYRIIVYDDNADMVVQHIDVDVERFKQHLSDGSSKLVNMTVSSSGAVYSVNEYYVP